jgi:bifunctional DNA-binding transcriptional regulator/antitoxin component of YhaV-PrlF toxin-antitoxin module
MDLHYLFPMAAMIEAEASLTSQNQITVPANVRKILGLQGGKSRVKFQVSPTGKVSFVRVGARAGKADDPALRPFLRLLAKDMEKVPARIKPFPIDLIERTRSAVAGVKVDLDGPLTGKD